MTARETAREQEVKQLIISTILKAKDLLDGHYIFFFGSRVLNNHNSRSDFDIGIDGESPLNLKLFYALKDRLESIETLYKLDLVDMQSVSPSFRDQAMKKIEVICDYRNNPSEKF
ncbi:MAG: nucleotidyltransferase domain-containing protein [Oligoflexia bacterium]|nr:nucleotidyltransferase domain-containing protein [Oligoflexia bacterium]